MIVCDRCGKIIDDNDNLGERINEAISNLAIGLGIKEDLPIVIKRGGIDLCDDCRKALNQWLKGDRHDKVN